MGYRKINTKQRRWEKEEGKGEGGRGKRGSDEGLEEE